MKCARCGYRRPQFAVTIEGPKSKSIWAFCPFHAERVAYILRVYSEAPPHREVPNPLIASNGRP